MTTAAPSQPSAALNINTVSDPNNFTNYTWAVYVLTLIGAPITQNNVNNFTTWMTFENAPSTWTGTAGKNNPLNNGLGSGGGSGLGSYVDLATAGIYAAKGVEGGIFSPSCGGSSPGGIAKALKADAPFPIFQKAVIQSGWAGSCYAGTFDSISAAAPPQAVSVASAGSHSSTHNPSVGSQGPGFWDQVAQGLASVTVDPAKAVAGAVGGAVSATVGWTDELGHLLGDVLSADFWKRVGIFIGGAILVVAGIILFVSTTKTGERVESDAESAAITGAVAA